MIRFSRSAHFARHQALADLLKGGSIALYEGRRPDAAEDPAPMSAILVLPLEAASIKASESGFTIESLPVATAERAGRAAWFRCLDKAGTPVCDGVIGTQPGVDMKLDNPQFWPGVELQVERFDIRSKVVL